MLPKKQKEAFSEFYDSARYNDILQPKTTLLLHWPRRWLLPAILEWSITLAWPRMKA